MSLFVGITITCDSCGENHVETPTTQVRSAENTAISLGWGVKRHWPSDHWICPGCIALDKQDAIAAGSGGEAR